MEVTQRKKASSWGNKLRRWSRPLHRDLSYLVSGMLIIYLISGLLMNHRHELDLNYRVEVERYQSTELQRPVDEYSTTFVKEQILAPQGVEENYHHHLMSSDGTVKIYLKGGNTIEVDPSSGKVVYTKKRLKWLSSQMTRLHYNPSRAWTIFSDVFVVVCLIVILTGLVMVKGKRGVWGRGGLYLFLGLLIPLIFMLI